MLAKDLIKKSIAPLKTSSTGKDALFMMHDSFVRHLPVVNDTQLLGLISESDIQNYNPEEHVGSYRLSFTHPYIKLTDHVYEVIKLMGEFELTLIPVVDEKGNYAGSITLEKVLHFFANNSAFADPGSILVIETHRKDLVLSEVARILEQENTIILSAYLSTPDEQSQLMDLTIKVNRLDVQPLVAALSRYDYVVKGSFTESDLNDSLKDRFDMLMTYLNV
jgi:acetoin utilization protein AcuB